MVKTDEKLRLKHLETLLKMFGFEDCCFSYDPIGYTYGRDSILESHYKYRLLSKRGDKNFADTADNDWLQSYWVTRLYCKTIEDMEFCCHKIISGVT